MKTAPAKNPPAPKPALNKAIAMKYVAGLKAASENRDRTERALFNLLEDGKGVDVITLTISQFFDISGTRPLPLPVHGGPLVAKDLFCKHSYLVNGKGPFAPGKGLSLEQRLQMKAGVPNLWKIEVVAEQGDAVYIPVGVACFPKAGLAAKYPAEAVKICTESKVFLYETFLFALFTADFNPQYLSKFAVMAQEAIKGGLGIIDPHVPNGY